MVDSISGNNINELQTGLLGQSQQVERLNRESSGAQKSGVIDLLADRSQISDQARSLYESEKEVSKYSTLSARSDEPYDQGKVSLFKDLVNNGRINQYLSNIGNNQLADDLLQSPLGASLA